MIALRKAIGAPSDEKGVTMRRVTAVLVLLAVLGVGCGSGESAPRADDTTTSRPATSSPSPTEPAPAVPLDPVDWNDRAGVDIDLPSGWHLAGCEGDAPFLCASTTDGTVAGTIMLVEYPAAGAPATRQAVEADAADLYRVTEEDRRITCGPDVDLEPDALRAVTVGGEPGYRYGYRLVDETGNVAEQVVLHVVDLGSRRIVVNTAFSDADGCPGKDPERIEFPIAAFAEIDPYLDQIVGDSVLPAGQSR